MCISCDHKFKPEIILKSKQQPIELELPAKKSDDDDDAVDLLSDDDLDIDVDEDDNDVELDADDNTTILSDDDDTDVSDVVDAPVKTGPAD